MKYYFILQLRMLNRRLTEIVKYPVIGYLLALIIFLSMSFYIFENSDNAGYIFVFISLIFMSKLSDPARNNFLKSIFSEREYRVIRIIENLTVAFPFLVCLLISGNLLLAAVLILAALFLFFMHLKSNLSFTIPTPFYKRPFEFTAGFRNTLLFILISYFTAYKSITIENFNLGIISVIFIFFLCSSFYSEVENEYYVWIFSENPRQFLLKKSLTAVLHSTVLVLPVIAGLCFIFPDKILYTIAFLFVGYIYLISFVLFKYIAFPQKQNLLYGTVIAFCLWLPPVVIFIIPFFYFRSVKKLNNYLEW